MWKCLTVNRRWSVAFSNYMYSDIIYNLSLSRCWIYMVYSSRYLNKILKTPRECRMRVICICLSYFHHNVATSITIIIFTIIIFFVITIIIIITSLSGSRHMLKPIIITNVLMYTKVTWIYGMFLYLPPVIFGIVKYFVFPTIRIYPDNKVYGANRGPPGADRTQVGPMLAPWTLLYLPISLTFSKWTNT